MLVSECRNQQINRRQSITITVGPYLLLWFLQEFSHSDDEMRAYFMPIRALPIVVADGEGTVIIRSPKTPSSSTPLPPRKKKQPTVQTPLCNAAYLQSVCPACVREMRYVGGVPSLAKLCISTILDQKLPKTLDDAITLTSTIPDFSVNPLYTVLFERLRQFLLGRAGWLLEKYEHEELERQFGKDIFDALVRVDNERIQAEKRMMSYRVGKVVEPTSPLLAGTSTTPATRTAESSISNHAQTTHPGQLQYYPLDSLLQEVNWPIDVDPTQREKYLSPEEFVIAFGMTLGEFSVLKSFKQVRLKKLVGLF